MNDKFSKRLRGCAQLYLLRQLGWTRCRDGGLEVECSLCPTTSHTPTPLSMPKSFRRLPLPVLQRLGVLQAAIRATQASAMRWDAGILRSYVAIVSCSCRDTGGGLLQFLVLLTMLATANNDHCGSPLGSDMSYLGTLRCQAAHQRVMQQGAGDSQYVGFMCMHGWMDG